MGGQPAGVVDYPWMIIKPKRSAEVKRPSSSRKEHNGRLYFDA
ncbi:hypothetical protein P3T23_000211 [Paraburkholderia sp. GAS448]